MYPFKRWCTAGKNFAFPCRDNRHAIMGSRISPNNPYLTAIIAPLAWITFAEGVREPVDKSL